MNSGNLYRSRHASGVMRDDYPALSYRAGMPGVEIGGLEPGETPQQRLGRVLRAARNDKGWSQEQLAQAAKVGEATVQRFENGKTATPDPTVLRRIFQALDLDLMAIPVVLGYVTAEEIGLSPQMFAPTTEQAIRILEDPTVSAASKKEWLAFLQYRVQQDAQEAAAREREAG